MASTASIKITKQITYRGQIKLFSNRYHFDGGAPSDNAHWTTLADAIVNAEKAIYDGTRPDVQIQIATGYAPGSEVPVFVKNYTTNATGSFASSEPCPGDVAVLVRYSTTQRTAKNHPVYLFNYYHAALKNLGSRDDVNTAQRSAITTYANAWITGFSDGTVTHHRAGPNGAVAQGAFLPTYLTHRDFPRG